MVRTADPTKQAFRHAKHVQWRATPGRLLVFRHGEMNNEYKAISAMIRYPPMRPDRPPDVREMSPSWESFATDGRDFLRTTLPDAQVPGVAFIVARTVAGRYRVDRILSIGESTVLLLAEDERLRRPVVIKALRNDVDRRGPGVVDGPAARNGALRRARHLLQTERRLLVRLRNAGCLAVPAPLDYVYDRNPVLEEIGQTLGGRFDPFLAATEPYLVLPYLSGESLEAALAREFPKGMEEGEALRGFLPVVRAMELMHRPWRLQNGRTWHCIYQDLKPANLMVEPDGSLMLIDFGGCQVVVDGVPVLEGSCTPGYAPPECEGPGPARVLLACADVFTIGSTLYHMLTGIDPRGEKGERFNPDSLPPKTSPGLRRLLARCLAPRPSDRLADAGRVASAIEDLLARDLA